MTYLSSMMFCRISLTILLIFQILFSVSSQVVTGRVVTKNENFGIPYVNIGLVNKGLGTCSDKNGYFSIDVPRSNQLDSLVFSAIGFEEIKIPLNNLVNVNRYEIALSERIDTLQEVVVKASKQKESTFGREGKGKNYGRLLGESSE